MSISDATQDAHLYFLELGVMPTLEEFNRKKNELAWNNKRRGQRTRLNSETGKPGKQTFVKSVKLETLSIEIDYDSNICKLQQRDLVLNRLRGLDRQIFQALIDFEDTKKIAEILNLTPQRVNQKIKEIENRLKDVYEET